MTPAERITNYINEKGIKQKFISKKTGIAQSSLSSKLSGNTTLTAKEVELICGALECSPNVFLRAREFDKE